MTIKGLSVLEDAVPKLLILSEEKRKKNIYSPTTYLLTINCVLSDFLCAEGSAVNNTDPTSARVESAS